MWHTAWGDYIYFFAKFNGINQAWQNKYIHAYIYIPISGAWGGAVVALKSIISNFSLNKYIPSIFSEVVIAKNLVPVIRTLESIPWLIPTSSACVFDHKILVSTKWPTRIGRKQKGYYYKNYTVNDYEELFKKISINKKFYRYNYYQIFQRVQTLVENYPSPNVSHILFLWHRGGYCEQNRLQGKVSYWYEYNWATLRRYIWRWRWNS